jgi:hypothetical protein
MDKTLSTAWSLASSKDAGVPIRRLDESVLEGVPTNISDLPAAGSPAAEAARKAIVDTVQASCGATLADALAIQAAHSARFMVSETCKRGAIGAEFSKTMI